MIAAILSIAATGVHVALRSAVVASTVRALNAASTTLNRYESLLYRRHDDDPQ